MRNARLELVQEVKLFIIGRCFFAFLGYNLSGHFEQADLFRLCLEVFDKHVVVCSEEDATGSVAD